tara:strand:+ start:16124 stop:18883 length:2760 start_codon:yes stop_codon:yes gene_type:complete
MSRRPGKGCNVNSGLVSKMWKYALNFADDPKVKSVMSNPDPIVHHLFEGVFGREWQYRNSVKYEEGLLRTFKNRLAKVKTSIYKGTLTPWSGKFGSTFYNPTALATRNPVIEGLINNIHSTHIYNQGKTQEHNSHYRNIVNNLKKHLTTSGYMMSGMKLNKATKKASDLEAKIEELSVKIWNGDYTVKSELNSLLKQEEIFYKSGEGKMFGDIVKHIEVDVVNAEKAFNRDLAKTIDQHERGEIKRVEVDNLKRAKAEHMEKYLRGKIKSEPMLNAVKEYTILMDKMHAQMLKGVNAYMKSIKLGLESKNYTHDDIAAIETAMKAKIMPDKQTGYFPHYKRTLNIDFMDNLMPRMQRVSDALHESLSRDPSNIDAAIGELKTYVTGHARKRTPVELADEYSKNFLVNVKRYTDEIDRFNMISHADMHTRGTLAQLKKMFRNGESLDGYGEASVMLIRDINGAVKGTQNFDNDTANNLVRSILALEFASKLGLNARGSLKNATQMLLNAVKMGPIRWMKSRKFWSENKNLEKYVDKVLDDSGLKFTESAPELQESLAFSKGFNTKIKITDNETIEFKKASPLQGFSKGASTIAGKSGYLMRKVENFNRKSTFKLAFYKMYNELNNSRTFKNEARKQGKDPDKEILRLSRNAAIRMTSMIHFDYSDAAKSKALRNPYGKVMGQFQHYTMKFTEFNKNLVTEAKDDILAGQVLSGERAQSAYIMALIYGLIPTAASAVTGLDFGRVLEHDLANRVGQLWTLFTGEDEEIKKAFYNRSTMSLLPFASPPVVSDLLALGHINEWWEMDEDSMGALLTGYQDYGAKSDDKKVYDMIRLLNVQFGRLYHTVPAVISGKPGWAAQVEMGAFPTKKARDIKKTAKKAAEELLPKELMDALELLEDHQKKAVLSGMEKKRKKSKNPYAI